MLHLRTATPPALPRRRLLALIAGSCGLIVLISSGLGLSLLRWTHSGSPRHDGSVVIVAPLSFPPPIAARVPTNVAQARDDLAARPMPDTGTGHTFGYPELTTRAPGPAIVLPPALGQDAVGVPSGFTSTPEGALAQLAAIDTLVLQSGSLPTARAVIGQWALPGGPDTGTWSGVRALASLLQSAGTSGSGSADLQVRVTPAMGLIKGSVGRDFVVACVDLTLDITVRPAGGNAGNRESGTAGDSGNSPAGPGSTRTVAVDCQRMVFAQGRWLIGPGPEPAAAPQVWPDTDAALYAGYRDLQVPEGVSSPRG